MNAKLLAPFALASLLACAPPPYEGATPSISVIFPETGTEDVYCSAFMVAVDIDNLDVHYPEEGEELEDGEGHWHLLLPNTEVRAVGHPWYFVDGRPEMLDPDTDEVIREAGPDGPFRDGGLFTFTAQLVDNAHNPLADVPTAAFEITIDDTWDPDEDGVIDCLGGGSSDGSY